MKELITKLYEYENFPIYLGSIIFVLIVAFFVVFFLGRKDQKKIEKTQRLEKVGDSTFKEVSAPVKVEIEAPKVENSANAELVQAQNVSVEENILNEEITNLPLEETANSANSIPEVETVEAPIIAPPVINEPINSEFANSTNDNEEIKKEESTVIEQKLPEDDFGASKEEQTYNYNSDRFDELANSIASELNELEKQQEIAKPILEEQSEPAITEPLSDENKESKITNEPSSDEDIYKIASFNEEEKTEPEKKATIVNDVFSSVYAPKKEEPIIEDTMAIELPKLKNEAVLKEEEETKLSI